MTDEDRRGWLWGRDPENGNADLMVIEIVGRAPKERARSIRNAEDAAMWERLTVEIAEIGAKGHIVVCDNGADASDDPI